MMSDEEIKNLKQVLQRFSEMEGMHPQWDSFDEGMYFLSFLDDHQIIQEAHELHVLHRYGNPRCKVDHDISTCFVPKTMDAVRSILDLYSHTGFLHPKNRYVLCYFLIIGHSGEIIS